MRAVVNTRYGSPDALETKELIKEVPTPEPKPDEVRVRVHATTVNRTDCSMFRGRPFVVRLFFGLLRPKHTILGMEFAGEVEAVGASVQRFAPGDRVFGMSPSTFGAYAEYLCVPEQGAIAPMPDGVAYNEIVACEGAWYADTAMRSFNLKPGRRILIYGASGAIGTAAVQIAKASGAEVTAVVATRHMDLAKSLGADHVIDYTAQDFTRIGKTFDFVVDAVGKTTFFRCRRLLKPRGKYVGTDVGPWLQVPLLAMWTAVTRRRRRVYFMAPMRPDRVPESVKTRMESGAFRAVIDRVYPLAEIVDAYRYVDTGQKVGIVVIEVGAGERRA